jgi:hypothetical protein
MYSKQCTMERKTSEGGRSVLTSWIPDKFAFKGRVLKLKDRATGHWKDGWVVVSVNPHKKLQKEITERSQDYKNTRKASDI